MWQKWIDDGTYANAKELAQDIGVHPTLVGRMLRLSNLAPRIAEDALTGREPEGLLQQLLGMEIPADWSEQGEAISPA